MLFTRFTLPAVLTLVSAGLSAAQAPARNIEPGLEKAVRWKWQAVPSPATWGKQVTRYVPSALATPTPSSTPVAALTYEVKKGDRLFLIAKKFGITVEQLKGFNKLNSDLIRIGQVLEIPNLEQAKAIAPMPEPRVQKKNPAAAKGGYQTDTLVLQIFLDREGFSAGSIAGKPGPLLGKVAHLYQIAHPEVQDSAALQQMAQAAVGDPFTSYTLRQEDFQFIVPPRGQSADPKAEGGAVYQGLITAPMLAYSNPWEFVAERFHCDEAFLRSLNSHITTVPQAGTEFRVPKVIPFEIERSLADPFQPRESPDAPVTATIEDLSLLQIFRKGSLIAVMPVVSARPGLRGRNTWTILGAIPAPRLATRREPTASATPPPPPFGVAPPAPAPTPAPLASPEFLPSGPNNPVGIIWIDLAKADSPNPLPYGLHGTSVPDQMKQLDSIGGFRMANWNIARAVRLLPSGTPLTWQQAGALAAPPGGVVPAPQPASPAAPAAPAVQPAPLAVPAASAAPAATPPSGDLPYRPR